MSSTLTSFSESSWGWALKCAAWVSLFLAPIHAALWATLALVAADLVAGVWASLKSGHQFKSSKLRQTIPKLLGYWCLIIAGFIAETQLSPDIPFVKIAAGIVSSTEIVSLGESLTVITGVSLLEKLKQALNKKE